MMRSDQNTRRVRVLFVCMGNICRSPMAEGAFTRLVDDAGLTGRIVADSAGTHGYHVGEPPDTRAQRAAARRGYEIGDQRGRQVMAVDFGASDYVLAMDEANLDALKRLCPRQHAAKLRLFMEFHADPGVREVPDPYYGGNDGFERVLDMVEHASHGLLLHLRKRFGF
jgi:protein-tyrosine phosphatase